MQFALEQGFVSEMNKPFQKYIVAFIDILGFSKMIDDYYSGKNPYSLPRLERALSITKKISITYTQKYLKQHNISLKFKQFSDCISISIPIDKKTDDSVIAAFGILMSIVKLYYMILLSDGILLRGGISIGCHKENSNLIFSEALVRAYKIENEKAVNPRILIDKSILSIIKEEINQQPDKIEIFNEIYGKSIIKDWDDEFFVSPFNFLEVFNAIGIEEVTLIIKDFFNIINKGIDVPKFEIEEFAKSDFDKEIVSNTIYIIEDFINKNSEKEPPSVLSKYKWLKEFALWNIDNKKSRLKFEIFKIQK